MRYLVIIMISLYQIFISPILKQLVGVSSNCRFQPTCSQYAKTKIQEYGIIRGGKMSVKRLFSCHPFHKDYGKSI